MNDVLKVPASGSPGKKSVAVKLLSTPRPVNSTRYILTHGFTRTMIDAEKNAPASSILTLRLAPAAPSYLANASTGSP